MKTGPGERNCTCNKGWTGDGSYCYPASSCSNHGDCDKDSQCIETTPGEVLDYLFTFNLKTPAMTSEDDKFCSILS